jgi:hypothetical protein
MNFTGVDMPCDVVTACVTTSFTKGRRKQSDQVYTCVYMYVLYINTCIIYIKGERGSVVVKALCY